MDLAFNVIRAALCLSRGGWADKTEAEVCACWDALTDGQRRAYVAKLEKLPGEARGKFDDELGDVPQPKTPPEGKPAGDEFEVLPEEAVNHGRTNGSNEGAGDDAGGDDGSGDDGGDDDAGGGDGGDAEADDVGRGAADPD